jgi:hypothetical protein
MTVSVRQFIGGILSSGGSSETYDTISQLPLVGNTQGSLAFVSATNRLYIWNGSGWFNIALINTNPTITQGPNASYRLATDGTPVIITLIANDPEGIPITWNSQVTSGTLGNTATIVQNDNVFTITPSTDSDDVGTFGVTFTASDGINVATAVASFTLVFSAADEFYNQSVVLTTSSTNNASNSAFVDSSSNNFAITRNGNTTQGTFSPFSPAGWSNFFDGTGDYLDIVDSLKTNDLAQTSVFTVEAWIYVTGGSTVRRYICSTRPAAANQGFEVLVVENSNLVQLIYTGVTGIASVTPVPFNVWTHVAFVRSGTTASVYVNGQINNTTTSFTNGNVTASTTFRIGATQDGAGGLRSFFGYISNLRIVKGTAVYTADFTPPTAPLTAIANTSLLTCQSNRFVDNSANNFAITRNGDTRVATFSPFLPTVPYDPEIHGGSIYFDGNGDYLSAASNAAFDFGTGDFTIESWVNPTINGFNFPTFLSSVTGWSTGASSHRFNNTGYANKFWFGLNGAGGVASGDPFMVSNNTFAANSWHHYAVTRSGNTFRMFVNGVLENTQTFTGSYNAGLGGLRSGWATWDGAQGHFTGSISNLRMIKGTALYTAGFAPPTAPVTAITNTSLLLNGTNTGIFDETGKILVETAGDVKVSTAVGQFSGSSMLFDGTGDFLITSPNLPFAFGTGNFTVECWIYATTANDSPIYESRSTNGGTDGFTITAFSSTVIRVFTSGQLVSATVPNYVNSWTHVAYTRQSGTNRLFVNGILRATATATDNFTNSVAVIGGGRYLSNSISAFFTGYIQDFRITQGRARYTADFTPPTAKLGYTNSQ